MLTNPIIQYIIAHWDLILKFVPPVLGLLSSLLSPQVRSFVWSIVTFFGRKMEWIISPFKIVFILKEQNEKILKELYPNTGSSLRDAINRLDRRQILLNDRILSILDRDETPIFETDDHGQFIWVNNAYLALCGRPINELIGFGWINSVLESDRSRVIADWDRAIEEKRTFEMTFSYENFHTDKITKAFVRAIPTKSFGEVVGWTGYITETENLSLIHI